jgi:hypothetical protein
MVVKSLFENLTLGNRKDAKSQVVNFVDDFSDRLKKQDVENILEMANHNEWGIAFEILCAQLYEWNSPISQEECDALRQLLARSISNRMT